MFSAHIFKYTQCNHSSPTKLLKMTLGMGLNIRLKSQTNGTRIFRVYSHAISGQVSKNLVQTRSRNSVLFTHTRKFRLSPQQNAIPPALLFMIRPIAKLITIFFGRTVRQWWSTLPPQKKQEVIHRFQKHSLTVFALFGSFIAGVMVIYVTHLENDPITGRSRFIVFSHNQMVKIAEMELIHTVADFRKSILGKNRAEYVRVLRVANRILKSNMEVPGMADREWTVTVVDEPNQINAFVLPNGNIFIFTGMLDACMNDDQLGVILAHEMSHSLLQHMAEQLSNVHLVEWLLLVPLVLIWAVLPDGAALLSQWLSGRLAHVMFHLPYSRAIEVEADQVGLQLAAKACFDVREASAFWTKMSLVGEDEVTHEWLSTHPNHEKRGHSLDMLIPAAIKYREQCNCPDLPKIDPRLLVNEIVQRIKSERNLQKKT